MYFHLQTSELLSGKAFNSISDILHFDLRNVRYKIPVNNNRAIGTPALPKK
ncbi:MAG: hypothetical protein O4859_14020 [Trichodesmium sp. St18_bin1]|nr:hypothetical protein [Trichodesmium sp. St18_bin1]MDE5121250.1 hypothetical protein [Trichodesmium sp. St19_bin1]